MTKKQTDEEEVIVEKLDLADSGDLLDKLYDDYFKTKSVQQQRKIRTLYEQVAAHHNQLAGFKRFLPTIRKPKS